MKNNPFLSQLSDGAMDYFIFTNFKSMIIDKVGMQVPEGIDEKEVHYPMEGFADFEYLLPILADAKSYDDLKVLRDSWEESRKQIEKEHKEFGTMFYFKFLSLIDSFQQTYSKQEDAKKLDETKKSILSYKTTLEQEPGHKDVDFKEKDTLKKYDFDQHQKKSLWCWAASHTYVMNTYMKVNRISAPNLKGKKFVQETFHDGGNFVVNEKVQKYLDEKDGDQKWDSMNFNKEAEDMKGFLTDNHMGNPYMTADVVINNLPRTAERHLIFTNFYKNKEGMNTPEIKDKLANYLIDKIEKELERTKAPISMLVPGHYLSIVGVDRDTMTFKTMDSRKDGAALNDNYPVDVYDLLNYAVVEFTYPEYLEGKNLTYIKNKFGLKDDLYDKKTKDMNIDPEMEKQNDKWLERPQNMMHINGMHFESDNFENDFEKYYIQDQIYMPKNLNLPEQLKKEAKNKNKNKDKKKDKDKDKKKDKNKKK
ncbi:MAG: hypothetical protein IJ695_03320 [Butyrivibrio sp.]|nr:hypothetical protein [Butyrivibrio sp.]